MKIAVTPRSLSGAGHPALSMLTDKGYELVFPAPGETPDETALLETIPGCVGWLAGVEPIGQDVLKAATGLRVISRNGVGVDNIHMPTADALGIKVERTDGANARGVAELAIALMLAAFRHVPWSDAQLHAGTWARRRGIEAEGRTLGVVGCGAIGRKVAQIAIGLGMKVIGYDPFPPEGFAPAGFRLGSLDEVITGSDAVTLHCPPGRAPIIDGKALAAMKSSAVIVNTARADLIDDDAVLAALNSGRLAALATDVYHQEPPAPSALLSHDRVILTPHAGGFTEESVDRATRGAVENILKVLEP